MEQVCVSCLESGIAETEFSMFDFVAITNGLPLCMPNNTSNIRGHCRDDLLDRVTACTREHQYAGAYANSPIHWCPSAHLYKRKLAGYISIQLEPCRLYFGILIKCVQRFVSPNA